MGRDQKRSGLMWVPTRVQLADGLTKSSVGVFLGNALTSGTAQRGYLQPPLLPPPPQQLYRPYPTSLLVSGHKCTCLLFLLASLYLFDDSCCSLRVCTSLQVFGTRDRCANARVGSSVGMNKSVSHRHCMSIVSVHASLLVNRSHGSRHSEIRLNLC